MTICTKNREEYFGKIINNKMVLNDYGEIVKQCWFNLPNHYQNCKFDEFIVMPNHVHGIVVIQSNVANPYVENRHDNNVGTIHELSLREKIKLRRNMLIPKIIGRFKMNTAKLINAKRSVIGRSIWQRSFYDHIIRSERSLCAIRYYIRDNPRKWDEDRNNTKNLYMK